MAECALAHDVLLTLAGGAIGFASSYAQWKLTLNEQKRGETRKQIERLIYLVEKYNNYVSIFVNKRNHPEMYFGEQGESPMPEISLLKDQYASEITPHVDKMKEVFSQNLPLAMIDPSSVEPIHSSVTEAKKLLLQKLKTV